MRKYFYTDGVSKFGPFSKDELKSKELKRSTKIWYYGLEKWVKMSELSELDEIISTIPPELKRLNVTIENKIQTTENNASERTLLINQKPNKSKLIRWTIGITILIVISL